MLNYKILDTKPRYDVDGDEEYIDLLANNYKIPRINFEGNTVIVNQYYVARPDLISLAVYGDDRYADIICKLNGISNPFELNEDDMLYLPSIEFLDSCINFVRNPSSKVNKENNSINIKHNNDNRKKVNEKRTANELVVGQENYIIDKSLGLVFY